MPCTQQHDDQHHCSQRTNQISFRSTFSRAFPGLRLAHQQQNLPSFAISSPYTNHQAVDSPHQVDSILDRNLSHNHATATQFQSSLSSNLVDAATEHSTCPPQSRTTSSSTSASNTPPSLPVMQAQVAIISAQPYQTLAIANNSNSVEAQTEQIRISVQDTHISHQSLINQLENNAADVLDSFVTHEIDNQTGASNQIARNATRDGNDYNEDFDSDSSNILSSLPPFFNNRQAGLIRDYLYNGSSFSGYQKSKNESYEVNVKVQFIDQANSYLCGYLCINHLTKSHPSLTTFFEGEIISKQHPFLTQKWEATEEIDRAHWSKFPEFQEKFSHNFNLDSFSYEDLKKSEYIYMRWKEHFLVPDHTITKVDGASYDGFYYVCYSKRTSSVRGYYFHINSENFERLVISRP